MYFLLHRYAASHIIKISTPNPELQTWRISCCADTSPLGTSPKYMLHTGMSNAISGLGMLHVCTSSNLNMGPLQDFVVTCIEFRMMH
jgi:hypothetical protein